MAKTLIAKFIEDDPNVLLTFEQEGIGARTKAVPVDVFAQTLPGWVAGAARTEGANTPVDRVLSSLANPEKWLVNALGTPQRYALLVEAEWRVAVVARPLATEMTLRYRNDDMENDDEDEVSLNYLVPPRVVIGVWNGPRLSCASIGLCEAAAQLPLAPTDTIHTLTPWVWANVAEDGRICWGSTTRPTFGQDGVSTIESAFFGSIFNDHIVRYTEEAERGTEDDNYDPDRGAIWYDLYGYHTKTTPRRTDAIPLPVVGYTNYERTLPSMLQSAVRHPW